MKKAFLKGWAVSAGEDNCSWACLVLSWALIWCWYMWVLLTHSKWLWGKRNLYPGCKCVLAKYHPRWGAGIIYAWHLVASTCPNSSTCVPEGQGKDLGYFLRLQGDGCWSALPLPCPAAALAPKGKTGLGRRCPRAVWGRSGASVAPTPSRLGSSELPSGRAGVVESVTAAARFPKVKGLGRCARISTAVDVHRYKALSLLLPRCACWNACLTCCFPSKYTSPVRGCLC